MCAVPVWGVLSATSKSPEMRSDVSVSVFYQAWASDSINEIHPEKLSGFLPVHKIKTLKKEEKVRNNSFRNNSDDFSFLRFKENELEKAIFSVADLKKQFEKDSKEKKRSHLKAPRAKIPNGSTKLKSTPFKSINTDDEDGTIGSVPRPLSPMSANIAALSKRFSNLCATITLPGQEPSSGEHMPLCCSCCC